MPLFLLLIATTFNPSALTVDLSTVNDKPDFTSTTTVRNYIASSTPLKRAIVIAQRESGFIYNQRGDMDITCWRAGPYYGEPVAARGIWQITRCYHPEITDEQADDPEWSTQWALPRIKDPVTCRNEWTTCRLLLGG